MANLWSCRFDTAPDAAASSSRSCSLRIAAFSKTCTGSPGVGRALGSGVLAARSARSKNADGACSTGPLRSAFVDGPDEDVHSFVERLLVERLGAPAAASHRRSRNEQVSLDLRSTCGAASLLQRAVRRRRRARLSPAAPTRLMPSLQHFRPAQPVLVAHFFLSHAAPRRDSPGLHCRPTNARRCRSVRRHCRHLLRGGRDAIARDLVFRASSEQHDASSDRDFAATSCTRARMTMVHLAGWRGPDHLLRRRASLFRAVRRAHHRQQLNAAEKESRSTGLVRGNTWPPIGHLVALLTTINVLPTGYNKFLQEDKEAVFGAKTLGVAAWRGAVVVGGLTLNRERSGVRASGLLSSTDVADYLVGRGVPFRRAHEIVGRLVRQFDRRAPRFRVAVGGRVARRQRALRPGRWRGSRQA